MLVGYMRVSKADGSQSTDLQRDALLAAGVEPEQFYEDHASGKKDDRPHLAACLKALRHGDTLQAQGSKLFQKCRCWCSASCAVHGRQASRNLPR